MTEAQIVLSEPGRNIYVHAQGAPFQKLIWKVPNGLKTERSDLLFNMYTKSGSGRLGDDPILKWKFLASRQDSCLYGHLLCGFHADRCVQMG